MEATATLSPRPEIKKLTLSKETLMRLDGADGPAGPLGVRTLPTVTCGCSIFASCATQCTLCDTLCNCA